MTHTAGACAALVSVTLEATCPQKEAEAAPPAGRAGLTSHPLPFTRHDTFTETGAWAPEAQCALSLGGGQEDVPPPGPGLQGTKTLALIHRHGN